MYVNQLASARSSRVSLPEDDYGHLCHEVGLVPVCRRDGITRRQARDLCLCGGCREPAPGLLARAANHCGISLAFESPEAGAAGATGNSALAGAGAVWVLAVSITLVAALGRFAAM